MSKQDLQGLKDASWHMDTDPGQQDPRNSPEPGMQDGSDNVGGNPNYMTELARQQGDDFISQQVQSVQQAQADWIAQGHTGIAPAAQTAFGNALHTATDRTSPAHQGEQKWAGKPWYNPESIRHFWTEKWASAAQRGAAANAGQALFHRTFGDQFDWMLLHHKGQAWVTWSDSATSESGGSANDELG